MPELVEIFHVEALYSSTTTTFLNLIYSNLATTFKKICMIAVFTTIPRYFKSIRVSSNYGIKLHQVIFSVNINNQFLIKHSQSYVV